MSWLYSSLSPPRLGWASTSAKLKPRVVRADQGILRKLISNTRFPYARLAVAAVPSVGLAFGLAILRAILGRTICGRAVFGRQECLPRHFRERSGPIPGAGFDVPRHGEGGFAAFARQQRLDNGQVLVGFLGQPA